MTRESWEGAMNTWILSDQNHGSFLIFTEVILSHYRPYIGAHRLGFTVKTAIPSWAGSLTAVHFLSQFVVHIKTVNPSHANSHRMKIIVDPVMIRAECMGNIKRRPFICFNEYRIIGGRIQRSVEFLDIVLPPVEELNPQKTSGEP
jgi:hypothetical protein